MRSAIWLLAAVAPLIAVLVLVRPCSADDVPAGAEKPSKVAEIAGELNVLLFSGGPTAMACVIDNGENSATTTSYFEHPFREAPDGTFYADLKYSVVNRVKGVQSPATQKGKSVLRLSYEGERVVGVYEYESSTSKPADVESLGNGIIFRERYVAQGTVASAEYRRKPDGKRECIERYLGLTGTVVYHEVDVPPELRDGPQEKVATNDDSEVDGDVDFFTNFTN